MPEQGLDAIRLAGLVLQRLDQLGNVLEQKPAHPLLGHGTVRVAMISGGTDAATVASSATLTIERRTLPGETPEQVEAELRHLLDQLAEEHPAGKEASGQPGGFAYDLTRLVARSAFEADPNWPIVLQLDEQAERVLGRAVVQRGEPFWTDAGLVREAGIPCLRFGVDGAGAHAPDEWATEASIHQVAEILEDTIVAFCG
jgi:acetylornithine deacetylase